MNAKYVILVAVALFSLTGAQPPVGTGGENERRAQEYIREALTIVENTDDCECRYQLERVTDVTADDDGSLHFEIRLRSEEVVDNVITVKHLSCHVVVTVNAEDSSQTIAVLKCTAVDEDAPGTEPGTGGQ